MTAARIAGRVAVVTGAARGIGRACALRLAEEGADIAALDIGAALPTVPYEPASAEQLEDTAAAVRALGRRCLPLGRATRSGVRAGRADLCHWVSYSSWRRHQIPVSLRPRGARSSHAYIPHSTSIPRS